MDRIITLILALTVYTMAHGEELLAPIPLTDATAGEVLADGSLRVAAEPGVPHRLLIEVDNPGITSSVYAIKGMVRYEGIEGEGYLQMDNFFDGGGSYFTKSLADTGPLRKLTGNSDWREFVLPFTTSGTDASGENPMTPHRLTLSLHLPITGTVSLRNLALYEYSPGENPLHSGSQWLSSGTMGLIGGIGGSVVGLWGALAGFLAGRGKARLFVFSSATFLVVVGVVSLAVGVWAFLAGQPYDVYFPFLLFGVLLVVVVGGLRRVLPRRYEAVELQKMQSMDA